VPGAFAEALLAAGVVVADAGAVFEGFRFAAFGAGGSAGIAADAASSAANATAGRARAANERGARKRIKA